MWSYSYPKPTYATEVIDGETYDVTPIEKLLDNPCVVAVTNDGLRLKQIEYNLVFLIKYFWEKLLSFSILEIFIEL